MAEDLKITKGISREATYKEIIPQIKALIENETDLIANLSNVSAALKEAFGFLWIGFYSVGVGKTVAGMGVVAYYVGFEKFGLAWWKLSRCAGLF